MRGCLTLVLFTLLLQLESCALFDLDHSDTLPPVTATGENTFGCLVNGKVFTNKGEIGWGDNLYCETWQRVDTVGFILYAGNTASGDILIISVYGTPNLEIGKTYDLRMFVVNYSRPTEDWFCSYRNIVTGQLILSKFTTTSPTPTSSGCPDEVAVTKGRFDVGDVQ